MKKVLFAVAAVSAAFVLPSGAAPACGWLLPSGRWEPKNPAPCYVRSLVLTSSPARAEMKIAAAGWFELRVNGVKAGEDVLEPVTCQPDRRISEVTHDVTKLLRAGTNEVEVLVGNGWYGVGIPEGAWGFEQMGWHQGVPPGFRGRLVADGATLLTTDGSWQVYDSPIVFSALRCGESYDARFEGERRNLRAALVHKHPPTAAVSPEDATPCRAFERYDAVRALTAPDGDTVFDFGHNISGWAEIEVVGEAGAQVALDYDEELAPTNRLAGKMTCFVKGPYRGQHDEYVLRGGGAVETWHPRFVYHGFRYVKAHVTGKAELKAIRARFVRSAFASAGSIETSDAAFARLQDAIRRSYLSNFVGIPTDCPHREKNGWTGDAQLACETGLWNFDSADGYRHFLRMMTDTQAPNGAVSCILPHGSNFGFRWGSGPAWDALLFELPRCLLRFRGDEATGRATYPAMKRYLAFLASQADADGLVDWGLGDWCCANGKQPVATRLTDSAYAWFFHREAAFWAERCGEAAEAARYRAGADRIRDAFNRAFYRGNGVYLNAEQTALAAPLYFRGLCADGEERKVAERLVAAVRAFAHKVDYGILGSKWIPRVLAEYGYADDAWKLMTQPELPGYQWFFRDGEDTLWETWGGGSSHNHIMFGDPSAWAFEYVAGIVPLEPGFRKVAFRPNPIDGVESFVATHRTPLGEIRAGWRRGKDGRPQLVFSAPPGVEVVKGR